MPLFYTTNFLNHTNLTLVYQISTLGLADLSNTTLNKFFYLLIFHNIFFKFFFENRPPPPPQISICLLKRKNDVALPEATPSPFGCASFHPPSLRSGSARRPNALRAAQLKPYRQLKLLNINELLGERI